MSELDNGQAVPQPFRNNRGLHKSSTGIVELCGEAEFPDLGFCVWQSFSRICGQHWEINALFKAQIFSYNTFRKRNVSKSQERESNCDRIKSSNDGEPSPQRNDRVEDCPDDLGCILAVLDAASDSFGMFVVD